MKVKKLVFKILLIFALCASAHCRAPVQITGQAGYISDGDTLWLKVEAPTYAQALHNAGLSDEVGKDGQYGKLKLRIISIDAPELCQPWGEESRAALQAKVRRQPLKAELLRRDDYGRWLARVWLLDGDKTEDIGAWSVAQGNAWDYQYASLKSGEYRVQQDEAREARRGLWAPTSGGVPALHPRLFRKAHGPCPHPELTPKPTKASSTASPPPPAHPTQPAESSFTSDAESFGYRFGAWLRAIFNAF